MRTAFSEFLKIYFIDFEFFAPPGENPEPICLVCRELVSGQEWRWWRDDLLKMTRPPFDTGPESLTVAFYASAEMGCFLSLGWEMPTHILDLYVEFRNISNGLPLPAGRSLLGALVCFGLDGIAAAEKETMRALAMTNGPFSEVQQAEMLDYCASDVTALEKLFNKMRPRLDVPRAIWRGEFMKVAAVIESNGVPISRQSFFRLCENWDEIKLKLIARVNDMYDVFDGNTFKADKFKKFLHQYVIPWPMTKTGRLDLTKETFRERSKQYPLVAPIHECRSNLSKLKLNDLAVGCDSRNRTMLSAFQSITGRNQPSNSRFIFGPAAWMRHLIEPDAGMALAYIDYSQQEFGIAAALSSDDAMAAAYISGDPYLTFAKQAGAMPDWATKSTHASVREQYKLCALAVQYGMGAESLGLKANISTAEAARLLRLHRTTYRNFWAWSDAALDYAMLTKALPTVFGWTLHISADANERSIRNFPMQANGAEILRLACYLANKRGIKICAPVHDALLIEAPEPNIEEAVGITQEAMAEAARIVLDGFDLRTDAKIIKHPNSYVDERGEKMWQMICELLDETGARAESRTDTAPPLHPCVPAQSNSLSSLGGIYA